MASGSSSAMLAALLVGCLSGLCGAMAALALGQGLLLAVAIYSTTGVVATCTVALHRAGGIGHDPR